MDEGDVLHENRVDLDLSAMLYDENWVKTGEIYYGDSYNQLGAYFSGDITDAPNGASEFIDFDLTHTGMADVRYITFHVNNFTHQPFSVVPEAFAGFMMREDLNSGEVYDPRTVAFKFDLVQEVNCSLPMIFDLVKRQVIWTDLKFNSNAFANNIISNENKTNILGQAITTLKKPNLHFLFSLHALARGSKIVSSKEEADTIFSFDEGITAFDYDLILSEYLI